MALGRRFSVSKGSCSHTMGHRDLFKFNLEGGHRIGDLFVVKDVIVLSWSQCDRTTKEEISLLMMDMYPGQYVYGFPFGLQSICK